MKFKLKIKVVKVEDIGNGLMFYLEVVEGGLFSIFDVNVVLVVVGWMLFIKGFGFEELGVKVDKFG